MNRPGFRETSGLELLLEHRSGEHLLKLRRRDVADLSVQPSEVEPVSPNQDGSTTAIMGSS
jgi:hypothetical protein